MRKSYREELVGVFGDPVDENPTVVVAQKAFEQLGISYRYVTINVRQEDLEDALKGIRAMNFKGIHLTIPHKVAALQFLDIISEEASIIGAVNTVVNSNGKLRGENTDGKGFMKSIRNAGVEVKGKKVTVLGAGGAARAIAVELCRSGIKELVVLNRSGKRGEELVNTLSDYFDVKISFRKWNSTVGIDSDTDVLVNATNIGMFPDVDANPNIDYDTISDKMVVCDVIPNPARTHFLQEAERKNAKTIDGLGMLVNQCVESIFYWTGRKPSAEVMKEALAKEYK